MASLSPMLGSGPVYIGSLSSINLTFKLGTNKLKQLQMKSHETMTQPETMIQPVIDCFFHRQEQFPEVLDLIDTNQFNY